MRVRLVLETLEVNLESIDYSYERLRGIAAEVGERTGWDFSRMRTEREPVPWDYLEVASRYITLKDTVLDIGTGGGEKLLALTRHFDTAVGVDPDPDMVRAARKNGSAYPNVVFTEMGAEELGFPDASFDVVLTRHAPIHVPEVVRVLKPGGHFVTQGVGANNMASIRQAFETGSNTQYDEDHRTRLDAFAERGCRIVATGAYDVRYWVKDIQSLIFWFKAIAGANEVPEGFSIDRDWQTVQRIIAAHGTPNGVLTNEHRTLLVVHKP